MNAALLCVLARSLLLSAVAIRSPGRAIRDAMLRMLGHESWLQCCWRLFSRLSPVCKLSSPSSGVKNLLKFYLPSSGRGVRGDPEPILPPCSSQHFDPPASKNI